MVLIRGSDSCFLFLGVGCQASLIPYSSDSIDTANWYDIWQAAVAVESMCGRFGRAGSVKYLGKGAFLLPPKSRPFT